MVRKYRKQCRSVRELSRPICTSSPQQTEHGLSFLPVPYSFENNKHKQSERNQTKVNFIIDFFYHMLKLFEEQQSTYRTKAAEITTHVITSFIVIWTISILNTKFNFPRIHIVEIIDFFIRIKC
jgi:hypothetical protein